MINTSSLRLLLTFVASPAKQRRPWPEGGVDPNEKERDGHRGAADVSRWNTQVTSVKHRDMDRQVATVALTSVGVTPFDVAGDADNCQRVDAA